MREETELKWIARLLSDDEFSNTLFDISWGTKSDFSRKAKVDSKDKEFSIWFKEMISKGMIESVKYIKHPSNGRPIEVYTINKKKVKEYLNSKELYSLILKI